jgi:hypothetical protein
VQFTDKAGEAGNAVAVHRRLRRIFQMFDAIAPVCRRKRFLRRACDYTFKMNEFAFEKVVVHCAISPWMASLVRSRRR